MIIAVKTIEQQEKEWQELLADYADLLRAFAEAPESLRPQDTKIEYE